MKVQTITTEEMRRNDAGEGLILQGCGGDLQEWVDGINDMLTESGILKNDTTFENVYKFEHDGLVCLLFPFRDVDLDMGRLAIWRLQTRETFGSMWLSDFVDNYLGGPLEKVHEGKIGEYVNITGSYEEREERNSMVEIRSAVHSNYVGMVAMLGADNRVYLGREERYYHQEDQPAYYDNRDGSLCFVSDQPDMYYFLYGEGWTHTQEEMLARGLTMKHYEEFARIREGVLSQFTPRREILFAGELFREPENYLRNAELYVEGQTGNYNMIDGLINNIPAGQEERQERPSLLEQLKTERITQRKEEILPTLLERERL